MVKGQLGHLIGLLSLHQYKTLRKNRFIVGLCYSRWQCAPFSWLLLDLLPVSQTNYKQVSKRLVKSVLNVENMDNFTALYASYQCFTFGTVSMHASPCAYGFLFFFPAFFYKFMLFEFRVKDAAGIIGHAQIAEASPGPVKVYTWRSYSQLHYLGVLAWLWEIQFGTNMFSCILKHNKSIFFNIM